MAKKYCYLFSEGNATMRELLGGKGANLAEYSVLTEYRRALLSQQKPALSTMRTRVSRTRYRNRSMSTSARWKK